MKRRPSSRLGSVTVNSNSKNINHNEKSSFGGSAEIPSSPSVIVTPHHHHRSQTRSRPSPAPNPTHPVSISRPPLIRHNEIARRTDMFGSQTAKGPYSDEARFGIILLLYRMFYCIFCKFKTF